VPYDSPNRYFGEFQRLFFVRKRLMNCAIESASWSTPQKSRFFFGATAAE